MKIRLSTLSAVLLLVTACTASEDPPATTTTSQPPAAPAAADANCVPVLNDGWLRLLPGDSPMHGGFGHIKNPCATGQSITAAESAAYAHVELHETTLENGVSKMRQIPRLELGANGGEALLAPGGLHLMLMHPTRSIAAGESIPIRFTLADGRHFEAVLQARNP